MTDTQHAIKPAQARKLYKTMKDLHDILIKNKINYWVTGGTLIGAIRHRGLVPWDDDGDICIMKNDVKKLRKLIPVFNKKGYILEEGGSEEDDPETQICRSKKDSCTWYLAPKGANSLGVDIFVMERIGPLITYADPYWRTASNGGRSCFFLYRFVFPLIPVRFGNFWLMTPYNAIEHLNQCYGPDWNHMSQRLYDHRLGKWINSRKRKMTANDYKTINPPLSTCEPLPPSVDKCMITVRPTSKVDDLNKKEVDIIAKTYDIKGRGGKSQQKLKEEIKKIV